MVQEGCTARRFVRLVVETSLYNSKEAGRVVNRVEDIFSRGQKYVGADAAAVCDNSKRGTPRCTSGARWSSRVSRGYVASLLVGPQ